MPACRPEQNAFYYTTLRPNGIDRVGYHGSGDHRADFPVRLHHKGRCLTSHRVSNRRKIELKVNLLVFEAVCDKFTLWHMIQPIQFSTRMLSTVEICKTFDTSHEFWRKLKHTRLRKWPGSRGQNLKWHKNFRKIVQNEWIWRISYLNLKVNIKLCFSFLQVFDKRRVQIFRYTNVLEHALEFIGVLKSTSLFQLGNHGGLGVITRRHMLHKPLGQHFAIELLKYIFVFNVLEYDHLEIQKGIWSKMKCKNAVKSGKIIKSGKLKSSRLREIRKV